jgi:hypothetical protein
MLLHKCPHFLAQALGAKRMGDYISTFYATVIIIRWLHCLFPNLTGLFIFICIMDMRYMSYMFVTFLIMLSLITVQKEKVGPLERGVRVDPESEGAR